MKIETLEKRSMLTDVYASLAILPIEVDEAAAFSVAVTLTDPNWTPGAQPPVVHPATTVTLQFAGSATQGEDYTVSSATISIPAWSGRSVGGSITLTVLRDNRVEGDETIDVSVGAGAGYTLQQPAGTISTTTRTTVIKDDPPRVSIWIAEGQTGAVREATLTEPFGDDEPGQVIVYVLRSGGDTATPIPITLSTGGTASGDDYLVTPGFSLSVGVYAELTIDITDDDETEEDEQLVVGLATSSNYIIDHGHHEVLIRFVDDSSWYYSEWIELQTPTAPAPVPIGTSWMPDATDPSIRVSLWERSSWVPATWLPALNETSDEWGSSAWVNGSVSFVNSGTTTVGELIGGSVTLNVNAGAAAAALGAEMQRTYSLATSAQTGSEKEVNLYAAGMPHTKFRVYAYLLKVELIALQETYQEGPTRGNWTLVDLQVVGDAFIGYTGDVYHNYLAATSRKRLDEESEELDVFTLDAEVAPPAPSVIQRLPTIRSVVAPRGMGFAGTESSSGSTRSEVEIDLGVPGSDGDDPIEWL